MDVIAEILKREGISTLFCFPTTPIIEAAAAVGIKPRWGRRPRSPEELLYVLNEGHWSITGTHLLFRHLPSPPRCKTCYVPFGGVGGRVVRLAGQLSKLQNGYNDDVWFTW